jgi:hypothetical protein
MANTEFAQKVLNLIRQNRTAFDMGSWFEDGNRRDGLWEERSEPFVVTLNEEGAPACGTTMCLAGWAAAAAGYELRSNLGIGEDDRYFGAFKPGTDVVVRPEGFEDRDGVMVYTRYTNFEELGAELLDIDPEFAEMLFHTTDYKAEQVLERLASGEPFNWSEIPEYEGEEDEEEGW